MTTHLPGIQPNRRRTTILSPRREETWTAPQCAAQMVQYDAELPLESRRMTCRNFME